MSCHVICFFFQAEDGIRDVAVTGVQTCALPILQNLIYTRRIVQPVAAVKLTGTTFGTDIGLLSAVDQKFASVTGSDNPILDRKSGVEGKRVDFGGRRII